MELRDPVGPLRKPEAHHGHVEHARITARIVLGAQCEEPVQRQILKTRELMNDQLTGKPVDARRNRRVSGEDGADTAAFQRRIEIIAVLQVFANPLQPQEPGVPLVGVEHRWRRGAGDLAISTDGAYATHAEQHLLLKPMVGTTAVQPVGHLPLIASVLLDVGIQHQ